MSENGKKTNPMDAELRAIRAISKAVAPLTPDQRVRALNYVCDAERAERNRGLVPFNAVPRSE